jgi:2-amino-4-hydroxy-6-hydroxymethyldihydropteridine diphosphokinase
MNTVVVSVGSNIEPEHNIRAARELVAELHELVGCSDFEQTEPLERPGQPEYLNGAFLVRTELSRKALRANLKAVEDQLGRVRNRDKYSARRIDLDIVVWNGRVVDDDYHTRDFVRRACVQLLPELENS